MKIGLKVTKISSFSFFSDLTECPDGYDYLGDKSADATLLKMGHVATVAECGAKCNSDPECWSIGYSPSSEECYLNKESQPTEGLLSGFNVCSKGNIDE